MESQTESLEESLEESLVKSLKITRDGETMQSLKQQRFNEEDFRHHRWGGKPWSAQIPKGMFCSRGQDIHSNWEKIEEWIRELPLEIALTSPSEYIREYRKFVELRKEAERREADAPKIL